MMAKAELWCRATIVGPGDLELAAFALEGPGDPDVGAVDDVARFVLLAKRLGGRLVLTDLSSSTGAQGIDTVNQAGTGTGGSATGNACVLVTYPSSIRYRGGHPRTYLPPPLTGILADDAHITTAGATAWATGWGDVLTTLYGSTSGGTTLAGQCAVSYRTGGAPRTDPLVMPIASGSASVKTQLASQRRRIGRK